MTTFEPNRDTALIFNIQQCSLHDGPGIRTTVFFNGCPLTCPWCCNPESAALHSVLMHDKRDCINCGRCQKICHTGAIQIVEGCWSIHKDLCDTCGACVTVCPNEVLELSGQIYEIDEVLKEILKDKAFFQKSGGGVTFSGGEALMQIDFIEHLAGLLHKEGIQIACETTGQAAPGKFKRLLEAVDFFLIDMKHYDAEKLQRVCNGNYKLIHDNTVSIIESGKPVVGRIPIIPGFNNSHEDIEKFAEYANQVGIKEIHLLPFHQFGELKYDRLQKEYAMRDYAALNKNDLLADADYLKNLGFSVQIGG
ncbi:MAG: glycyl-radical enzyme activating protein [Hungatella sp.]